MNTLITILATSRGWIIRQALKSLALITAPLAVWLETQGQGDHAAAIVAGLTALVSALLEVGLSFMARKNR